MECREIAESFPQFNLKEEEGVIQSSKKARLISLKKEEGVTSKDTPSLGITELCFGYEPLQLMILELHVSLVYWTD